MLIYGRRQSVIFSGIYTNARILILIIVILRLVVFLVSIATIKAISISIIATTGVIIIIT